MTGAGVQRRMQADHLALGDDPLEVDEIAAFGRLPRRVAHPHLPAQAAQQLDQAPADLPCPDHAIDPRGRVDAFALGQGQHAAQHVVHHAAGVAARRAAPGDAGLGEVVEIQMIGADGAGADETHAAAFQQRAVDAGHRAHQQEIGVAHIGRRDGPAGQPADAAEGGEELVEQGNVFVGDYMHGGLRGSGRHSMPARRQRRPACRRAERHGALS
jgi:hypothetical protein